VSERGLLFPREGGIVSPPPPSFFADGSADETSELTLRRTSSKALEVVIFLSLP